MPRDFSEPQTPNTAYDEVPEIDDPDNDGDDDEIVTDPGSFDGGYGQGSYFQHAMRHD